MIMEVVEMVLESARTSATTVPASSGAEGYVSSEFGKAFILMSEDESEVEVLVRLSLVKRGRELPPMLQRLTSDWARIDCDFARSSCQEIMTTVKKVLGCSKAKMTTMETLHE
jgi:hypothetical protein